MRTKLILLLLACVTIGVSYAYYTIFHTVTPYGNHYDLNVSAPLISRLRGKSEGPPSSRSHPLKLNDIQAVGSHNSYKQSVPHVEMALIRQSSEDAAKALDYSHLPLSDQLDLGMRQLEIDIYYDPNGGLYSDPLLPRITSLLPGAKEYDATKLASPGYKVMHAQDVDPRSSCLLFIECLTQIRNWSINRPDHAPILILLNTKDSKLDIPGTVVPLKFTEEAFDDLDRETLEVFSHNDLITPDHVRGSYPTLREAVVADNWPMFEAARGRVMFALDARPEIVKKYMRGKKSLEGLPIFVNSISTDADHAAYFTVNNPVEQQAHIQQLVKHGFIVRTRADADTKEARMNETQRREAAFASGAHYISTDYYLPRHEWGNYYVENKGQSVVACNPVRLSVECLPNTKSND
ncbi:phosphatidylinositol-specific phospholipase C1-like protein [Kordiimonas sp. SCSIO 12610]|uniref:phosphatidylinositol-specific phospholipase C1-like protein n=1 Tax=Kordiimonas sp. SCSIO 12610 TaxID=2829597 RepID=UPI00210B58F7|nr:phosphatidylinositol-specific phospholipase C1-like protein [Kordiimonas sp. SCSIO 12610]UTW54749.1 phosphatidylinositol-specific phospholipase C1-like protein [Kordiimonas sp. SCSIO 12610]